MNLAASIRASRLCIVGNLNRDIRTAPLPAHARLDGDGETATAALSEAIGGGGAQSAVHAAALGAAVSLVARIGADALGSRLREALVDRGVRPFLTISPESSTGTSLALAFSDGHRHFISCLPSSHELSIEDVPAAAFQADHLLRADVWFSEAMLFGGNRELLGRARDAGMQTSLDINWDPCWGSIAAAEQSRRIAAVVDILPLVDLAHGNVRELCTFTGCGELPIALRRLEHWGCGSVVVHLGASGSAWWQHGQLVREPAAPVMRMVHSAGSGDLLSVIMICLQRCGVSPGQRLRYANDLVSRYIEGSVNQPAALDAVVGA